MGDVSFAFSPLFWEEMEAAPGLTMALVFCFLRFSFGVTV